MVLAKQVLDMPFWKNSKNKFKKSKFLNSVLKNSSQVEDVKIRDVKILHYILNAQLRNYAENLEKMEPDTLDWIDSFKKNSIFYDIGALSGPFTLYAAIKTNAKVIAFEPEAQNFAALEMNHYLNRKRIVNPIISLNLALSDSNELGKLYMSRNVAGSTVKILDKPALRMNGEIFEPGHVQFVLKFKLDDVVENFALPYPNYVKIDVDGAEEGVLMGAKGVITNNNIKSILIELVDPEGKSRQLVDYLINLGYSLKCKNQVEDYEGLYNCIFVKS